MRAVVAFVIMVLGLTGCWGRKPETIRSNPGRSPLGETYEIVVSNASDTKIYPVLSAGSFQDDLGVVGAGAEACEGFVPFKIGRMVTITWQIESLRAPTQQVNVATGQYAAKSAEIKSFQFQYRGGSNWIVNAYNGVGMGASIVSP